MNSQAAPVRLGAVNVPGRPPGEPRRIHRSWACRLFGGTALLVGFLALLVVTLTGW